MFSLDGLFQVASIPDGYVAGALLICIVAALTLSSWRRRRINKRMEGEDTRATARERRVERILFILTLVPTVLIWLAVLGISFFGLVDFAQTDMGIVGWVAYGVPASLDGISIAYGVQAFRSANKGHDTGNSSRVVLIGATMSAALNFSHGWREWTFAAGVYLAFLSMMGMQMFHDLLKQFIRDREEKHEKKFKRGVPQFGERWVWAPLSTFKARRMWIVHPPLNKDLESTVTNALAHWRATRRQLKVDRETDRDAERADIARTREALTPTPRGPGVAPSPHPLPVGGRGVPPRTPQGGEGANTPTFTPYTPPLPPGGGNGNTRPTPQGVNGSPQGGIGAAPTLTVNPPQGVNGNPVNGHGVPTAVKKARRTAEETVSLYHQIRAEHPGKTKTEHARLMGIDPKTLREALNKVEGSSNA